MIKKNLFKVAAVLLSCCLVFASAGCGKKKTTVSNDTAVSTEHETKENKKTKEEQVTIAVKDAEGNTVEVAGIVKTNEEGEKVVFIQDRDGNRTEIKADNYEESTGGTITITDETVSNEISEAAKDDKIPKADEVIPTRPSTDVADNNDGNSNGGNGNNSGSSSGSSSSDNGSNSTSSEPETKPSTPDTPSHEHSWEPVYETVHHDAVTREEQIWVVDKDAWEELVYKEVYVCAHCRDSRCERCLKLGITEYEYDSIYEFEKHQDACLDDDGSCFNFVNYKKLVETITHQEEGHYETQIVIVSKEYDEKILIGYRCKTCGETKSN